MVHFSSLTFIYVFSGFLVKILLYSWKLTNLDAKTDDSKILDKTTLNIIAGGNKQSERCPVL